MRVLLSLLLASAGAAPAAEIHGSVVSALDGKPLKRAEVILRSMNTGQQPQGVTTDDQGRFSFLDVPPGRYLLQANRDGFVPSSAIYQRSGRLALPFALENDMADVAIRMLPAATISGKVRHGDGEPAPRLLVNAYRELWERNRHRYEIAGRAVTDDRGEYRFYGLPPGRYTVAAIYQPYQGTDQGTDDVQEQLVRDAYGQKVAPERTVTTFAPSTWRFQDATQFQVRHGLEATNADIFLARSRTTTIRGRILNGRDGQAGEGTSIALLREDASGSGYVPYPSTNRMLGKGEFEIKGVTSGRYALEARGSDRRGALFARQPLTIGNAAQMETNILLLPELELHGRLTVTTRDEKLPQGVRIAAEPRNAGATRAARVENNGQFVLRLTAGETYDLLLQNPPDNLYLKNARLNTTEALATGLRLESMSTTTELTIEVSERGGQVRGETRPGANVILLPAQPLLYRFSETIANEWGYFAFRALAPGEYRAIAWYDEPPCEIWSPHANAECANFGTTVRIDEGSLATLTLDFATDIR